MKTAFLLYCHFERSEKSFPQNARSLAIPWDDTLPCRRSLLSPWHSVLLTQYSVLITQHYKYGIRWRTFLVSADETNAPFRSCRLRFFPLLESKWLLKPLFLFTLPLPVILNRFAAPLLVLILGTFFSLRFHFMIEFTWALAAWPCCVPPTAARYRPWQYPVSDPRRRAASAVPVPDG